MKELRSLIVELNKNGKSHITAKCPFCEREFNVITWNSFYSRNNKDKETYVSAKKRLTEMFA